MYYEIGILDSFTLEEIHKYVTSVPIQVKRLMDKLADLIYKNHGKDVIIAWNTKYDEMPQNIDEIKFPKKETIVELKYNR